MAAPHSTSIKGQQLYRRMHTNFRVAGRSIAWCVIHHCMITHPAVCWQAVEWQAGNGGTAAERQGDILQSLTALNSSRVMTLFMSESNWLNKFRMATKPEETRSSSLGLPSAVTFRQPQHCQGSVFSATIQGRSPTRVSEASSQGERASELRALRERNCARPSAVLGWVAWAGTVAWQRNLYCNLHNIAAIYQAQAATSKRPGSLLACRTSADLDGSKALAGCVGGCLNALHEDAHVGITVCLATIVKGPAQPGSNRLRRC